jgi:hypothetical protein
MTRSSGAAISLTEGEARRLRFRSQLLAADRPTALGPTGVVRALGGVQAQVLGAAALAVRARSSGLRQQDLTRALEVERSLVRTWLLRGTLHVAAAQDIHWMLSLLGPRFAARDRRRRLQLGLDDEKSERGLAAIRAALAAEGPLTRGQLVEELARRGVILDPRGQDRAHLIALAALQGLVCLGPMRRDEPTYVLLEDWIGPARPMAPEDALAHLARRYLAAFGPAGPEDLAAWSGIPVGQARQAMRLLAAERTEVEVAGAPAWVLGNGGSLSLAEGGAAQVRLLPAFDAYLLGYRDRRLMMSAAAERRIQRGGGWLHPTVAVDGWVVASWKSASRKGRMEIDIEPFEPISAVVSGGIDAEVEDIQRFLEGDDPRADYEGAGP